MGKVGKGQMNFAPIESGKFKNSCNLNNNFHIEKGYEDNDTKITIKYPYIYEHDNSEILIRGVVKNEFRCKR